MLDVFDYRASDLIGATVLDDRGESVAKVDDIVVSIDDDKLHAVLAIGGFVGFGAKLISMPFDDLQITSDDGGPQVRIAMTGEQLEQLVESRPEFRYERQVAQAPGTLRAADRRLARTNGRARCEPRPACGSYNRITESATANSNFGMSTAITGAMTGGVRSVLVESHASPSRSLHRSARACGRGWRRRALRGDHDHLDAGRGTCAGVGAVLVPAAEADATLPSDNRVPSVRATNVFTESLQFIAVYAM